VLRSIVSILEKRDSYTQGHSDRVSRLSEKIAQKMGFIPEEVQKLKDVASLHDIGKIVIGDSILVSNRELTAAEWEVIKSHPVVGEELLKPAILNRELLLIVRCHHERYDGKGYPDRLAHDDIPIFAQIIAVADAYDAMTSNRSYRNALKRSQAIEELKKHRGTQFNPRIVDVFLLVLEKEYLV